MKDKKVMTFEDYLFLFVFHSRPERDSKSHMKT